MKIFSCFLLVQNIWKYLLFMTLYSSYSIINRKLYGIFLNYILNTWNLLYFFSILKKRKLIIFKMKYKVHL